MEEYALKTSTNVNNHINVPDVKYDNLTAIEGTDLGIGSMVQVTTDISEPLHGVLRWLGKSSGNLHTLL